MLKCGRYHGRDIAARAVSRLSVRARIGVAAFTITALSVPAAASATTAPAGIPVLQDRPQVTVSLAGDNPETGATARVATPKDATYNLTPGTDGPWVILHPQVFLVFWGSWWFSTSALADHSAVINFFKSLGGTNDHWSPILNQYYEAPLSDAGDNNVNVYNSLGTYPVLLGGSAATGSWIDPNNPPKHPTDAQMAAEAALAYTVSAQAHTLSTQVIPIVITPKGVESQSDVEGGDCGHHSWSYWLRDVGGGAHWNPYAWAETGVQQASYNGFFGLFTGWLGSCNWGTGTVGGLTAVLSHEFAEAVTDPFGNSETSYTDPGGQSWQGIGPAWTIGNNEIGDVCIGKLFRTALGTGTYWLQEIHSNATHACAKSA
jgi:hypothetical protein